MILGHPVIVQTDHQPLVYLFKEKHVSGRLAKFCLQLQTCDICITYKAGTHNTVADFLSRMPSETDKPLVSGISLLANMSSATIIEKQCKDKYLKLIHTALTNGLGSLKEDEQKSVGQVLAEYECKDGVLYHKGKTRLSNRQIAIPESMKKELMEHYHDGYFGGHLSSQKVLYKLQTKYHWPTIRKDVMDYVKSCHGCQS